MTKKTEHVPAHLPRIKELMSEAGWRRPEELAASSGLTFRGAENILKGATRRINYGTSVAIAVGFSKKLGREVDPNWIRGLE